MKTLLLIRHAKSSWKDPSLTDLQRPLKKRGEKNAVEMAERILSLNVPLERVFTSPANRAVQTVERMAAVLEVNRDAVEIVADLYSFEYGDVMRYLRTLNPLYNTVAVVGHNPAITDLVNFLALDNIKNIPTCGIALLKLNVNQWDALKAGCAELSHYDYPKNEMDNKNEVDK